jgi:putative membrane protein
MKRASKLLSDSDRKKISEAVAEAEKTTSGEIVTTIATSSGRYDRAEDIFGLLVGLVSLGLCWMWFQGVVTPAGAWGEVGIALGLLPCIAIVVVGFALGSALATYFPVLRSPFIPKTEILEDVARSAHEVFARERVRGTAGGTGILIYLSLYERVVHILPDDAIAEKVDSQAWNEVRDLVINGIVEKRLADGLVDAVAKCGELLSEHFPIQPGDENELTNELRIID